MKASDHRGPPRSTDDQITARCPDLIMHSNMWRRQRLAANAARATGYSEEHERVKIKNEAQLIFWFVHHYQV